MENQAQIIETNFSVMGLSRIRHKDGENRFLGDVLYRHLNRTTSKSVTFDERINMMVSDAEVLQGTEDPEVDPRNYYAPTALKTDQERYIETRRQEGASAAGFRRFAADFREGMRYL